MTVIQIEGSLKMTEKKKKRENRKMSVGKDLQSDSNSNEGFPVKLASFL